MSTASATNQKIECAWIHSPVARLVVVFATILASLVLLEVGLRVIGRYRTGTIGGHLRPGGLSFLLKTNFSKTVNWPATTFTVHTCDFGFREKQPGARRFDGSPYVAILGSSEVFGNGLDYKLTFVGVLAEKLGPRGVQVINMAVPGHHLLEQVDVFEDFVRHAPQMPQQVVIIIDPLLIGGYDDVHDDVTVKLGGLFPKDNWRVPLVRKLLADLSTSYCYFRDGIRNLQTEIAGRPDLDLSFYLERYSTKHRLHTPAVQEDMFRHLKSLEARIRSVGATPVCVYIPTVGGFFLDKLKREQKLDGGLFDTSFFPEILRTHCQAEGLRFINAEPALRELYDRGEQLNFDGDSHFNGPTSQRLGEFLYDSLKPGKD